MCQLHDSDCVYIVRGGQRYEIISAGNFMGPNISYGKAEHQYEHILQQTHVSAVKRPLNCSCSFDYFD